MAATLEKADQLYQLAQAAFSCSQFSWVRGDELAFNKARNLHRKYAHMWRQAKAREHGASANQWRCGCGRLNSPISGRCAACMKGRP